MPRHVVSRSASTGRKRHPVPASAPANARGPRPTAPASAGDMIGGARSMTPLEDLASLTQVSSSRAERCPVCTGTRLTHIAMILTDGSPVDFTSCHHCEHKSWVHDGSALPIDTVLARARKPR